MRVNAYFTTHKHNYSVVLCNCICVTAAWDPLHKLNKRFVFFGSVYNLGWQSYNALFLVQITMKRMDV